MAKMAPMEKPSRAVHEVCMYWLMSSEGFRAKEQVQPPSRTQRENAAIHTLFTVGLNPNTAARTPEPALDMPAR